MSLGKGGKTERHHVNVVELNKGIWLYSEQQLGPPGPTYLKVVHTTTDRWQGACIWSA